MTDERIILITGGTRGIGREAALGLAQPGIRLVLVARDRARGEAVAAEVGARTGGHPADVLLADLSSQANVRALATEVRERYPRVDVLINNAGAIFNRREVTVDGLEMTFALNHLAPFLLTHLLLDCLTAAPAGRVVTVSSDAHRAGTIDPDDLLGERRYRGMRAYANSKLANILFTYELARRLEGSGVTANCLHPGFVSTGFGKNKPGLIRLGMTLVGPFITQPREGADNTIYLASAPEVVGITGRYFVKRSPAESSPASRDRGAQSWLWEASNRLTGLAA